MSDKPLVKVVGISFEGLSEPAKVFVEKIASAVGLLYEPIHTRRMVQAYINSEKDLDDFAYTRRNSTDLAFAERARFRQLNEEIRRQKNLETIVFSAATGIAETDNLRNVDQDWIDLFVDRAKLISDEKMQQVWANLLRGQYTYSKKFSKMAINTLASLECDDAMLYERFVKHCILCVSSRDKMEFAIPALQETRLNDVVIGYSDIDFIQMAHLEHLGLIHFNPADGYSLSFSKEEHGDTVTIQGASNDFTVTIPEKTAKVDIGAAILTKTGNEILRLCKYQTSALVERIFLQKIKESGFTFIHSKT